MKEVWVPLETFIVEDEKNAMWRNGRRAQRKGYDI